MPNPQHTDFLAFMPDVVKRLETVQAIKKVFHAHELADLDAGKNISAIDGCVYVILDSFAPSFEAGQGSQQLMDIRFSIILAKQHYNQRHIGDIGKTLTAIAKSLIGYEPKDQEGQYLTTTAIYLEKGAGVLYQKGFALYPLRFKTQSVIVAQ